MNEIIIPVITVTAVGLVCGILLALASKFMSVKIDDTEKKLRQCLPGANCGACGYTGCDGYAKALADDHSIATNLCIPGAESVSLKLAEILGVEAGKAEKYTAYVACHGDCRSTFKKHSYEGIKSCAAEAMYYGSSGICSFGCIGLGDCQKACNQDAICIKDELAYVNQSKCIGCGNCAAACPKHIIAMLPAKGQHAVACSNKDKGAVARRNCTNACIGCKKCEKNCPSEAITVVNNLSVINALKCTNCGICETVCPVGCIKFVKND